MARQKLTLYIAFKAALALHQEGEVINGHTLWLKVDKLGSLTTSKKWADLWNALERGEDSPRLEYSQAYEAVKRGEEISHTADIEEIPSEIQSATDAFLTSIYTLIQEQFEQDAHATRELCSDWVKEARLSEQELFAQRDTLRAELERAQQWELHYREMQGRVLSLEATLAELRSQIKDRETERKTSDLQKLDLSQRLGESEEGRKRLEIDLAESQQRLTEQLEAFNLQVNALNERERECHRKLNERVQKLAVLTTRIDELEQQRNRDIQRIEHLELVNRDLSAQLYERLA